MIPRSIKTVLSCCVAAADHVSGWRPRCMVLYYHMIPENQQDSFRAQLDALVRIAEPISAIASFDTLPAKQHVAVTFDDGFVSATRRALPELRARRIPVTLFVPAGEIGRAPDWKSGGEFNPTVESILSEAEIRELATDALVTFGSHGLKHLDFTTLTESEARRELVESKRILEAILQKPVTAFSFPFGSAGPEHVRWAHEAGYTHVFGTDPLPAERHGGGLIGRVRVDPWDSRIEFGLKLRGAYRWLFHAIKLKRALLRS